MRYKVIIQKKIVKALDKMPSKEKQIFFRLVRDLEESGPIQKSIQITAH